MDSTFQKTKYEVKTNDLKNFALQDKYIEKNLLHFINQLKSDYIIQYSRVLDLNSITQNYVSHHIKINLQKEQSFFNKQQKESESWSNVFSPSIFLEELVGQSQAICNNHLHLQYFVENLKKLVPNCDQDYRMCFDRYKNLHYTITIKNVQSNIDGLSHLFALRPASDLSNQVNYNKEDIKKILLQVYSAFKYIKEQASQKSITINTGFFGCGKYKNNHTFIALIQFIMADYVGIGLLNFNTFDNITDAEQATEMFEEIKTINQQNGKDWFNRLVDFLFEVKFPPSSIKIVCK